jgi:hypothetical protein
VFLALPPWEAKALRLGVLIRNLVSSADCNLIAVGSEAATLLSGRFNPDLMKRECVMIAFHVSVHCFTLNSLLLFIR